MCSWHHPIKTHCLRDTPARSLQVLQRSPYGTKLRSNPSRLISAPTRRHALCSVRRIGRRAESLEHAPGAAGASLVRVLRAPGDQQRVSRSLSCARLTRRGGPARELPYPHVRHIHQSHRRRCRARTGALCAFHAQVGICRVAFYRGCRLLLVRLLTDAEMSRRDGCDRCLARSAFLKKHGTHSTRNTSAFSCAQSYRTLLDGSFDRRFPRHFVLGYDWCCPYGTRLQYSSQQHLIKLGTKQD